jgi:cytoskeletal protein CcmA (bactofilin family)
MLGDGCSFEGKMFLQGEARLGGKVTGSVYSDGILIVEATAQIYGEVSGNKIQLNGFIQGNIRTTDILKLSPTARVSGDITVARLIVEEGARINGKITFLDKDEKSLSKNDDHFMPKTAESA